MRMKQKLLGIVMAFALVLPSITTATFAATFRFGPVRVADKQQNQVPELPSYTDPVLETTIEEDETPL